MLWVAIYTGVMLTGVAMACGLTAAGLPRPRVDDGFYKSVGAELVQHHRFAVPCAQGLYARADEVFACYPPLYPLMVGAWYAVFGVSLRTSLAFSYAVHLLGVLAVMELARRLLARPTSRCPDRPGGRAMIVAGVGVIHLVNLAYFDRLEETGLLWVWLEVLTVQGRPGLGRAIGSGLCVGLAGLTSPWAGVLGALVVTYREILSTVDEKNASSRWSAWIPAAVRLMVAGSAALALVGVWLATMEVLYPGAVAAQFGAGLRQLKQLQCEGAWWEKASRLCGNSNTQPDATARLGGRVGVADGRLGATSPRAGLGMDAVG